MFVITVKFTVRPPDKVFKNRIFIFHDDETILDDLVNRFSRPSAFYKKEILPLFLDKIKVESPDVYKKVKDTKWLWNKLAGCTCGCSPGFVGNTKDNIEFFVTINNK